MPRQRSDISSDEDQHRVNSKENRAPSTFSFTAKHKQIKQDKLAMSKQLASKRKPTALGTKSASGTSAKANFTSHRSADASSEEQSADERVAETQFDEDDDGPVRAKATKGKSARAGEEDEQMSAREKRLQAKLDITNNALNKIQKAFDQLSSLRSTDAEASEKALTKVANERYENYSQMISSYKSENRQLQDEISTLRATLAATKSSKPTPVPLTSGPVSNGPVDAVKLAELESNVSQLEAENLALSAQVEAGREKAEVEKKRVAADKDGQWKIELAKAVKAKEDESAKEIADLRRELAAEIEHSKSLRAKTSTSAASTVSSIVPTSTQTAAIQDLKDQLANAKSRAELAEDLTGFTVNSFKPDENGHPTYSCILQDCLGKVPALTFKIQFRDDGSVRYNPDVDPARDRELADVLPEQMQAYMRFRAEDTGKWFRSLFKSLNKLD